jgi:hypothetical protein
MRSILARLAPKPKPRGHSTHTKQRDADTFVPLIKTLW